MENHNPIHIFIAYSSKDEQYLKELRVHLEPLQRYKVVNQIWFDGEIRPGEIWEQAIKDNLDKAKIILLMLSPDFLHSHYCEREMVQALDKHEAGTAVVVPIVTRPCLWQLNPQIKRIEAAIKAKAISTAPDRDELYVQISHGIAELASQIREGIPKVRLDQLKKEKPKQTIYTTSSKPRDIKIPEMVFVKGGILNTEIKSGFLGWSKSPKSVTINDFWIGKYLVTNEEYAFFLNRYGSDTVQDGVYKGKKMVEAHKWGVQQQNQQWQPAKGYERHPIIYVTWYGANAYCEWLKQETGEHYQLPDEWHWEWAARGGQQSKGYQYAGSNDIEEVAWYDRNSNGSTNRVAEKKANELGLYDMSGNVWEWCINDWKGDTDRRVVRGGSWYYDDYVCAVSNRSRSITNDWLNIIGVRVSRY